MADEKKNHESPAIQERKRRSEENHRFILLKRIRKSEYPSEKIWLTSGTDNKKFSIHTIVLTAASEYFAASLGSDFQEGRKSEFQLDGTDGDMVEAIVEHCYTGEINLTAENVGKFLAIASGVQLDLLEAECRQFYEANLNINNCVEQLMIADRLNYTDMRQKAFELTCDSFNKVPTEDIQKMDHRLFEDVLKYDKIQATEELVFQRLMEWFHRSEVDRKSNMPELLKLIRLNLMTPQFLNDTIEPVYRRFDGFELIFAEHKRRASSQHSSVGVRYSGPICLFEQRKGVEKADCSAIRIEKFNAVLSAFEDMGEITLGDRSNFGLVLHKNKIYVMGGSINNVYLKSASAFDLYTGKEEVLPEMNYARRDFTQILHGKYIYVFGGWIGAAMKTCERFDTESKKWDIIKEMNVARYYHSVSELNEGFCVAGGSNGATIASVELYDLRKDEWTLLAEMNKPRSFFAMTTWNGFMYLFGDGTRNAVEMYDSVQNCWKKMGSLNTSNAIAHATTINGELFVIMRNGEFGRIMNVANCRYNVVPLGKSKYQSKSQRHFLYQNEQ